MDNTQYNIEFDCRENLKDNVVNKRISNEEARAFLMKKLNYSYIMSTRLINKWCIENNLKATLSEVKPICYKLKGV